MSPKSNSKISNRLRSGLIMVIGLHLIAIVSVNRCVNDKNLSKNLSFAILTSFVVSMLILLAIKIAHKRNHKEDNEVTQSEGNNNVGEINKDEASFRQDFEEFKSAIVSRDVDKVTEFLKSGFDFNKLDDKCYSLLYYASFELQKFPHKKSVTIAKLLINNIVDLNMSHTPYGQSALHLMARTGNLELVSFMLEKTQCDYEKLDNFGASVLHHAVYGGNKDVVEKVIQFGRKMFDCNLRNKKGLTPIQYMNFSPKGDKSQHKMIVELLIENGAEINSVDDSNNMILNLALQGSDKEMFAFLLQKGADPNCLDANSSEFAKKNGYLKKIEPEKSKSIVSATLDRIVDHYKKRIKH